MDGYVSIDEHREERAKWRAELEEKSDELAKTLTDLEAAKAELKQLRGSYSNVLNNFGASKAKYDRAQKAIGEARVEKNAALSENQRVFAELERVGGSYVDGKIKLPVNYELVERAEKAEKALDDYRRLVTDVVNDAIFAFEVKMETLKN